MSRGQRLTDALKDALTSKGQGDRMNSDNGLFFVNDVLFMKAQDKEKITVLVEYEYGG